jgi:DNA-binding transcriptional regulator/RsmH inhibitor MraZ
VTLRGNVESLRQRLAAVHDAREVDVSAGRITLSGRVMELADAEADVASLTGVVGVDNHLELTRDDP